MSDMKSTMGILGRGNVVGSVPECLTREDEARFSQTLGLIARMLMVNLEDSYIPSLWNPPKRLQSYE